MGTKSNKRKITEEESLYADEAFGEYREKGFTNKKCPWCGGKFIFLDKVVAYQISCDSCDFKITARGI